jgi:hypothetical protein
LFSYWILDVKHLHALLIPKGKLLEKWIVLKRKPEDKGANKEEGKKVFLAKRRIRENINRHDKQQFNEANN